MDSYTKELISIFLSDKEVMYNPNSDKLTHGMRIKDEMVTVPDIGNTQAYLDDESSKATKIVERMHNFIVNKTVLVKQDILKKMKKTMNFNSQMKNVFL
jgi:hypothetical protein